MEDSAPEECGRRQRRQTSGRRGGRGIGRIRHDLQKKTAGPGHLTLGRKLDTQAESGRNLFRGQVVMRQILRDVAIQYAQPAILTVSVIEVTNGTGNSIHICSVMVVIL